MFNTQKGNSMFEGLKEDVSEMGGLSVTQLINHAISQPRGGILPKRLFTKISLGPGLEEFPEKENIHPTRMGLTVDYLFRFDQNDSAREAFRIPLAGSQAAGMLDMGISLVEQVRGFDADSVRAAIKLVGFDAWVRRGGAGFVDPSEIEPNDASIAAVQIMVERSRRFLKQYGPIVEEGMKFHGGYTRVVNKGDADFMTADALWDMKALKSDYKPQHTLQLLMYWRMGLHSVYQDQWQNIDYLGIFNPRKNEILRIHVDDIPDDAIKVVEKDILGYPEYLLSD